MSSKPKSTRLAKAAVAMLVLFAMILLYQVRESLPMSVFVLFITVGIIVFGLALKSMTSDDDQSRG